MANTVSEGDLEAGDVIYRLIDGMQLANHYGVYVGDGAVIHLSRELGLRRMTFEEFAKNYEVSKKRYIYISCGKQQQQYFLTAYLNAVKRYCYCLFSLLYYTFFLL